MNKYTYSDFTGGWLVGDFAPSLIRTSAVEVGIKYLSQGFVDLAHYHLKFTEFNVVVYGEIELESGLIVGEGQLFIYKPGQVSQTHVRKDSCVLVIRDGSCAEDKYLVEGEV